MAGVIAILRKALEQIAADRSEPYSADIAHIALQDAARLSQDCLKPEQSPTPCEDEHVQYSNMCG